MAFEKESLKIILFHLFILFYFKFYLFIYLFIYLFMILEIECFEKSSRLSDISYPCVISLM